MNINPGISFQLAISGIVKTQSCDVGRSENLWGLVVMWGALLRKELTHMHKSGGGMSPHPPAPADLQSSD